MSPVRDRLRSSRIRGLISAVALVVVVAVVATVALVSEGFDVKQPVTTSPFVWVLRGADGTSTMGEYARVDTRLGELDTVRNADAPSSIIQNGDTVSLLANDDQKSATVNVASPQDFGAKSDASRDFTAVPDVRTVVVDGDYVAYIGSAGTVSVARFGADGLGAPQDVDPSSGSAQADPYTADAVAVGTDGVLYAYSTATDSVLRWDTAAGRALGEDKLGDAGPDAKGLLMTAVGDDWVLYGPRSDLQAQDRVWTRPHPSSSAVALGTSAALQEPSASGDAVEFASSSGMTSLLLDGSSATQTAVAGAATGTPARPVVLDGVMHAAWLQNAGGSVTGVLWSADQPESPVTLTRPVTSTVAAAPEFLGNGSTAVLNDGASGLTWLVPSGTLVTGSDDWDQKPNTSQNASNDQDAVRPVADEEPPQGFPDSYGVRPGALVSLPVLLNDSDPNGDVITIAPGSITRVDSALGSASITTDLERIAFQVSPSAKPGDSTTFQYTVTDGLTNQPPHVTVTVTVVRDSVETAPRWCADIDEHCVLDKPSLQVKSGGSGSVNVLEGWVDPEGDPLYVKSAVKAKSSDPGSVAVTENGTLFFQSPARAAASSVSIVVTVADSRGLIATQSVPVSILSTPTLSVAPFSVVTHVGDAVTIDPSAYVSNAAGPLTLSNWTSTSKDAKLAAGSSRSGFTFSSATAGTYPVSFSVSDGTTSGVTARARVTVLSDAQSTPTVAPITIFVRPSIDSTVDVLSAVSDPAHRLLSVSAASPDPASADDKLGVDVVDHRLLRVTGSTAGGDPGVVGSVRYTVTGGDAPITGVATVVMLDSDTAQTPIAVDDAVTARVGAQIDVPVLDNDVATDGSALRLDPTAGALTGQFGDGLDFASGDDVRLLAPTKPGRYSLEYSVYPVGAPTKSATATIVVTVRAAGTDDVPKPADLEARVVAGQTVTIPFSSYGLDPDGDRVSLTRITKAPAHGSASIAATGDSISYSAVDDTFAGVDEFSYEVMDPSGERGTATVRVGVLAATTPSSPVTYTDYVQITRGAGSRAYIDPLANDFDPLGDSLSLVCVEPDLPGACGTDAPTGGTVSGSAAAEKSRLAGLLTYTKGKDRLQLSGDTTVGTNVYMYEVRADEHRFTYGYIVVNIVDGVVPDAPRVTDTHVGVDDRDALASTGLDVVSGHTTWQTGDVDSLTLALAPGAPAGFSVSGHTIRGPSEVATTTVVPFSLTGVPTGETDASKTVTTYGFLVVPGDGDIVLSALASAKPPQVVEASSVTFSLTNFLSPSVRDRVQLEAGHLTAALHKGATCTADSSGADARLTYRAVLGAPFADECIVPMRLTGQSAYSLVAIPIEIVPKDPVPLLTTTTAPAPTLNPLAKPTTINLMDYVSWQSGKVGDASKITFAETSSNSTDFTVHLTSDGRSLSLVATDGAVEGRKGVVVVRFAGAYSSSTQTLTIQLTVGPIPDLTPTGAHLEKECHTGGTAGYCALKVVNVGTGGERTYFDGGLTLVGKAVGSTDCGSVQLSLNRNGSASADGWVTASWTGNQAGITCTSRFAVRDASNGGKGHISPASQYGLISWSIEAPPADPSSIEQSNWGDKQIQFRVDLGAAVSAYPALTHVWVHQRGTSGKGTDCLAGTRLRAQLTCTVSTTANDVSHVYDLSVENAEGTDRNPVSTSALSYAAPTIDGDGGRIELESVYDRSVTNSSHGVVKITVHPGALGEGVDRIGVWIDDSDGSAADYRNVSGSSTTTFAETVDGGRHSIIFRAINRTTKQPTGDGLDGRNDPDWSGRVLVATTPTVSNGGAGTIDSAGSAMSVSGFALDAQGSTREAHTVYYAWPRYTQQPECSAGSDGYPVVPGGSETLVSSVIRSGGSKDGGSVSVASGRITGLQSNTTYEWSACSGAGYGVTVTEPRVVHPPIDPPANTTTYSVRDGSSDGNYTISLNDAPQRDGDIEPVFNDSWRDGSVPSERDKQNPDITYHWCYTDDSSTCSDWVTVAAKTAHQEWQLHVDPSRSLSCTAGQPLQLEADPYPNGTVTITDATYYNSDGDRIEPPADDSSPVGTAPADAAYVRDVTATITWTTGAISGLPAYTWNVDDYDTKTSDGWGSKAAFACTN